MKYWWLVPFCKTLHYFGITVLVGVVGLVDLRIFGVAKGLPVRPLQRLMPWAVVSFLIAAVSGYVLLRINPANSLGPPVNIAFAGKIVFLVLIGLNDVLYFATGLKRQVDGVGRGGHPGGPADRDSCGRWGFSSHTFVPVVTRRRTLL